MPACRQRGFDPADAPAVDTCQSQSSGQRDSGACLRLSLRCSTHTQEPISFSRRVTSSATPPPPATRMLALSGSSACAAVLKPLLRSSTVSPALQGKRRVDTCHAAMGVATSVLCAAAVGVARPAVVAAARMVCMPVQGL